MPTPGSTSLSDIPQGRDAPAVDVLIPHYNAIDELALTLASVDAQDWTGPMRIVVADDGSDAAVLSRLRAMMESRETPSVLLENTVNRGRPFTRNVLLDAIESPYTAWIDAGDEWAPAKTTLQMKRAADLGGPEADPFWVTCNYDWKPKDQDARRRFQNVDRDQVMSLLRGKQLRAYLWTVLGPSRTFRDVGWFDEALPRLQDLDFFLRFVLKGGRLHLPATADSLCTYHKAYIGRDAEQVRACYAHIFDKHRVLYNRYGPKFARVQLYNMEIHAARFATANHDPGKRRQYLWRAFRHRPKQFMRRMLKNDLPR